MAPPPQHATTVGGRRVNRKKIKASQRLSEKAARKTAKQDEARAALTKFHIELAKGKYDDPLLRVIKSKASGDAPETVLSQALVAQKKEFLSGAVPVKQQLQVKAFCEKMAAKMAAENKENKDNGAPKKKKELSNAAAEEMAAMD